MRYMSTKASTIRSAELNLKILEHASNSIEKCCLFYGIVFFSFVRTILGEYVYCWKTKTHSPRECIGQYRSRCCAKEMFRIVQHEEHVDAAMNISNMMDQVAVDTTEWSFNYNDSLFHFS